MQTLNDYMSESLFDNVKTSTIYHVGDNVIPKSPYHEDIPYLSKISHSSITITFEGPKAIILGESFLDITKKIAKENHVDNIVLEGNFELIFKNDYDFEGYTIVRPKDEWMPIWVQPSCKVIRNMNFNVKYERIIFNIDEVTNKFYFSRCKFECGTFCLVSKKTYKFPKHKNCDFSGCSDLEISTYKSEPKYYHNKMTLRDWLKRDDILGISNIKIFLIDTDVYDTDFGTIEFIFNKSHNNMSFVTFTNLLGNWSVWNR